MRLLHEPAPDALALANVLYALSDPLRLRLVAQLAAVEEQCCGTFGLPIAKSTLSHHFKVLRESGVTRTRLDGMQRFISLRRADLEGRFPGLLDAVLRALPETDSRPADMRAVG